MSSRHGLCSYKGYKRTTKENTKLVFKFFLGSVYDLKFGCIKKESRVIAYQLKAVKRPWALHSPPVAFGKSMGLNLDF